MFNSKEYWENRYKEGKSSGAGSYGILANFKSEVVNKFIFDNQVETVVEFGCGDGNQLNSFACKYYTGYDVSNTIINKCKEIFKNDKSKLFYNVDEFDDSLYDLSISLDVIYHLVEDDVFDIYMNMLFKASKNYVIIYSSNGDVKLNLSEHLKDRNFTNWVEKNINDFKLINKIENKYKFDIKDPINTSISDFYIYKKINKI